MLNPAAGPQLERCLKILNPASNSRDEDVFVALMLIPKLLADIGDRPDELGELMSLIYNNMNFQFLSRLLLTTESSEQLPSNMLHAVAVHIVSCLVGYESLVDRPEIASMAPLLVKVVSSPSDENSVKQTALQSLYRLVSHPPGARELLARNSMLELVDNLTSDSAEELRRLKLQSLERCFQTFYEQEPGTIDVAVAKPVFDAVLDELAAAFERDKTKWTMEYFQLCIRVLSVWQIVSQATPRQQNNWSVRLRSALSDMLSSKLGRQQRDLALVCCSMMLRLYGSDWLLAKSIQPTESQSAKGKSTAKVHSYAQFAALLIHLSCAEIRVLLDDLNTDASELAGQELANLESKFKPEPGSESESESDDKAASARQTASVFAKEEYFQRQHDRVETVLPVCFEILECFIQHLSAADQDASVSGSGSPGLSHDQLLSIRSAMKETFVAVMAFLSDQWNEYLQSGRQAVLDNTATVFSLRAMSSWLAEETSSTVSEILSVIPMFVEVGKRQLATIDIHPLDFLGPALLEVLTEKEACDSFVECRGHAVVASRIIEILADPHVQAKQTELLNVLIHTVITSGSVVSSDPDTFAALFDACARASSRIRLDGAASHQDVLQAGAISTLYALVLCNATEEAVHNLAGSELLSFAVAFIGFMAERATSQDKGEQWEESQELWLLTLNACATCVKKSQQFKAALSPVSGFRTTLNTLKACRASLDLDDQRNIDLLLTLSSRQS